MRHGSLFSGIGGFDLAAEWIGWKNIFHCEIAEFPRKVLNYYWPKSISYADITTTDFTIHRGSIDVLTGGFPCQPYSAAGKRLGKEDARHLWPEMLRVIREVRPKWIVGENVLGLVNWSEGLVFEEVCADLEAEGYEVQPFILPAAGVNAPHLRYRVWFVAHAGTGGDSGNAGGVPSKATQTDGSRSESSPASGKQVQLSDKPSAVFGDARNTKSAGKAAFGEVFGERQGYQKSSDTIGVCTNAAEDTIGDGRLCGEPDEEGADVREQRNAGAGDTERVRGEALAGIAADTDGSTTGTSGEGGIIESNGSTDNVQQGERREQTEQHHRPSAFSWNVAYTDGIGLRRESDGIGNAGFVGKNYKGNNWETFPTQSPLCGGDDGLPAQLDGIAFSKWRNESIKGYGNAVVPQVVYQIFKAIDAYEHL